MTTEKIYDVYDKGARSSFIQTYITCEMLCCKTSLIVYVFVEIAEYFPQHKERPWTSANVGTPIQVGYYEDPNPALSDKRRRPCVVGDHCGTHAPKHPVAHFDLSMGNTHQQSHRQ